MAKQSPSLANSSLCVFSEFASNLLFYFCSFCFECGDVSVSESHPFCPEYHVGENEVAKAGTFVEITFRAIWTYKSMQTFFWLVTQPSTGRNAWRNSETVCVGGFIVPSALLLGLGSKLYPRNMPRVLNKDLTCFMPSLSRLRQNRARKRKALLAEWYTEMWWQH